MDTYKGKRVLVTGGTGFIGSRLVERLVFEEAADVCVLVNNWSKATWVSRLPVKLIKGSINVVSDLEMAMESCSVVFHCVGVGGTPEQATKINVDGTNCVLEAAKTKGVDRVVYFSSAVVHGPATYDGLNELSPTIKTGDAYADSKVEAEKLFWKKTAELGIEGTVLRPTYVWGANSQYYTVDFINQMKARTFTWVDDGQGECNAVHVDNVVDVALVAGLHPNAVGEAFLITDGETMTWRTFFSYYAKMVKFPLDEAISGYSKPTLFRKWAYRFKKLLIRSRDLLTTYATKPGQESKQSTRYLIKAPRKLVKSALKKLEKSYPDLAEWDLLAYSSTGRIDLTRLEKIIGYVPKKSVKQGMEECDVWLRDQYFIKE